MCRAHTGKSLPSFGYIELSLLPKANQNLHPTRGLHTTPFDLPVPLWRKIWSCGQDQRGLWGSVQQLLRRSTGSVCQTMLKVRSSIHHSHGGYGLTAWAPQKTEHSPLVLLAAWVWAKLVKAPKMQCRGGDANSISKHQGDLALPVFAFLQHNVLRFLDGETSVPKMGSPSLSTEPTDLNRQLDQCKTRRTACMTQARLLSKSNHCCSKSLSLDCLVTQP
jgi:hypothetical protein